MNTQTETTVGLEECALEQMVTFQVGSEEYGFDILEVREIVRQANVTRIPLAPKHVKGVTNLRGDVLPVIDLRTKFGLEETASNERSRILVVDKNERQTALIVDAVHQVTRVEQNQLDNAPDSISAVQGRYLKNVARLDDGRRIVMNLDPDKVCEFSVDQSLFETDSSSEATTSDKRKLSIVEQIRVLVFVTDGVEYCLPISNVQEVIPLREPRRPTNAPEFLTGVLALRGKVLPIVNMRSLFRRRTIEAQRSTQIAQKRLEYENWADKVEQAIDSEMLSSQLLKEGRALLSQNEDLRSADSDLNRSFDQIRLGLHSSLRTCKSLLEQTDEPPAQSFRQARSETAEGFESCTRSIAKGARQDQRIVVIHCGSFEIGLQVDAVREVREIPKSNIEEPPALSKKKSENLVGVAKIEAGKRMILMIDADNIIPKNEREALAKSLKETAPNHSGKIAMNVTQESRTVSEEIQLVCFRIGDDEFGAPINTIREIDRVSRITAIPEAPHYIEGLSNLRGEVLPIINLRKRFLLPEKQTDDKSRVVVADIEGRKTGLLVDSVSHVLRIQRNVISGPPQETSGSPITEFVTGIAKAENGQRIIVVVDLERLIKASDTPGVED